MENKSGENKDNRDNWFENAEDGVEQELFADVEETAEPKEDEAENLVFGDHAEQEKTEEAEALQEDDDRELKETPKEKKKWMLSNMSLWKEPPMMTDFGKV